MKALSLLQPWATLIAIGAKTIETRSWSTTYRGEIAIHASKRWTGEQRYLATQAGPIAKALTPFPGMCLGSVVAVARMVDCVSTDSLTAFEILAKHPEERAFGDFSPGRFMWILEDVRALPAPVHCKGALSLWELPSEVEAACDA